jgi:peroxiredoxin
MQKIIQIILIGILFFSCKPKNTFTVNGTVKKMGDGEIYFIPAVDSAKTDTIKVKGDKFTFTGLVNEPTFYMINFGPNQKPAFLVIEKGEIILSYELDEPTSLEVIGGNEQKIYSNYLLDCKLIFTQMDSLSNLASSIEDKPEMMGALQTNFADLENQFEQKQLTFIQKNKTSISAAFIGANYLNSKMDASIEDVDKIYSSFDQQVKESYFGKQIAKRAQQMKATQIGQIAPNFELNNLNAQPVSLNSLRGKVILIDFWASWCGPCRKENPNVVKAYNQFKNKGFDILGISLDTEKVQWQDAVAKDGLTWTQVSDLKGWNSDVALMYGIQSIPMNYLLDKDGKIIAKDLRGDDLINQLQKLLKQY